MIVWTTTFLNRKVKKRTKKPRLIFGDHPLQSNQYWSNSLKKIGYASLTLMKWPQGYQNRSTYDMFIDEIKVTRIPIIDRSLVLFYPSYIAFTYAIRNYDIFHHHFYGGFLCNTPLKFLESSLLKIFDCKTVITAVGGGDFYRYNKIVNSSLLTGHLLCYPDKVYQDEEKQKTITYWTQHADCIMTGFQIDGLGRWDVMPFNMVCIETEKIKAKSTYSNSDGSNDLVKIFHAPNHRGAKGTEFIIDAVNRLSDEGLNVQLVLLEGLQNDKLLELLRTEADILVDQLLFGYGLNAIEGMAIGLPVITNLENEEYTRAFRRYSYLNECPAVSGSPETIQDVLRILIKNPKLREELGRANRCYAVKYHSEKTAQFIYENIYNRIWHKKQVDLMALFLPLNSDAYNNQTTKINHPLIENKLPKELF